MEKYSKQYHERLAKRNLDKQYQEIKKEKEIILYNSNTGMEREFRTVRYITP